MTVELPRAHAVSALTSFEGNFRACMAQAPGDFLDDGSLGTSVESGGPEPKPERTQRVESSLDMSLQQFPFSHILLTHRFFWAVLLRMRREAEAHDFAGVLALFNYYEEFMELHEKLEDQYLVGPARGANSAVLREIAAEIDKEHTDGERSTETLKRAVTSAAAGDEAARKILPEVIGTYTKMIHRHSIRAEEGRFLPEMLRTFGIKCATDIAHKFSEAQKEAPGGTWMLLAIREIATHTGKDAELWEASVPTMTRLLTIPVTMSWDGRFSTLHKLMFEKLSPNWLEEFERSFLLAGKSD